MKSLLMALTGLALLAACNGGKAPAVTSSAQTPKWNVLLYRLEPQTPENQPLIVRGPYELELPRASPAEMEPGNSTRLSGPGLSRNRQVQV